MLPIKIPCRTTLPLLAALVTLATLVASTAGADVCGDANLDGVVDDTDAVLVFRRVAGLSSSAVKRTSDLDVDGVLTDADAVRSLRLAAGLPDTVSCTASQIDGFSDRSNAILRIGAAAIPGGARIAQSTIPCANGGFRAAGATSEEHVDCNENGLITNGIITFDDDPQNSIFRDSYQGFSFFDLSTFENLIITGTLAYDFSVANETTVTGTLDASSNLLGTFTDQYFDIVLNDDFNVLETSIRTDVTNGLGAFANLSAVEYILLRSGIEDLIVFFSNGTTERTVFGEGLCDRCSSSQQCGQDMGCFPCVDNCGGTPRVCSVDFVNLNCGPPGVFGPPELCAPCVTGAECGSVLSCFQCDSDCSGFIDRCSSNVLFVECVDGFF